MDSIINNLSDLGVVTAHYANIQTSGGAGSRFGPQSTGGGQPAGAGGTPIVGNMTGAPSGQLRPSGTNTGLPKTKLSASSSPLTVSRSAYAASPMGARVQIGLSNLIATPTATGLPTPNLPGGLYGLDGLASLKEAHPRPIAEAGRKYPEDGLYDADGLGGFNIFKGFDRTFTNLWRTFSRPVVKVFTNPTKLNIGDAIVLSTVGAATPFVSAVRNPKDTPYLLATGLALGGAVVGAAALMPASAAGAAGAAGAGGSAVAPVIIGQTAAGLPIYAAGTAPLVTSAPLAEILTTGVAAGTPVATSATGGILTSTGVVVGGTGAVAPSVVAATDGLIPVASGANGGIIYAATPASTSGGFLSHLGTAALTAAKVVGTTMLTTTATILTSQALQPKGDGSSGGGASGFVGSPTTEAGGGVMQYPVQQGGGGGGGSDEPAPQSEVMSIISNPWVLGGSAALLIYWLARKK